MDRTVKTYFVSKFAVLDGDGAPIAVAVMESDITEQKRTEALLREAEEQLRLLLGQRIGEEVEAVSESLGGQSLTLDLSRFGIATMLVSIIRLAAYRAVKGIV